MLNLWKCILIVAVAGVPGTAMAYIGPGAGLSAIGSLLALIAAVLLAIIGFVWYPAKRFWRRRRQSRQGTTDRSAA